MYDLVERYIRRLDQDLYKFKMELEADNAGITEILEKSSWTKIEKNDFAKFDLHEFGDLLRNLILHILFLQDPWN